MDLDLRTHRLERLAGLLDQFELPAIAYLLHSTVPSRGALVSKFGGDPVLPRDFDWPENKGRPLDFLLQINLAEVSPLDPTGLFPRDGLVSFFYDLENQPWGYDPKNLGGFRVLYSSQDLPVVPWQIPDARYKLPERRLKFWRISTLPHPGSRAIRKLEEAARLSEDEWNRYWDLVTALDDTSYPSDTGLHRLLGHSANVQGDMQLEAQLVTSELYCGDESGYEDPRARELESGADDWILLLQLDSDEGAEVMWGDGGMLYFWIRDADLRQGRFDRVWMTLQCH